MNIEGKEPPPSVHLQLHQRRGVSGDVLFGVGGWGTTGRVGA